MLRFVPALLLGALLLGYPAEARAQMIVNQAQVQGPSLVGSYVNLSSGNIANVFRSGRGYLFVDENGDSAFFVHTTPTRLELASSGWAPTVVTVVRAGSGRTLLRFDSFAVTGFWRQIG